MQVWWKILKAGCGQDMTAKLQNLQAGTLDIYWPRLCSGSETEDGQMEDKVSASFKFSQSNGMRAVFLRYPKVPTVSVPASAACRSLVSAGSCYCLSWRTARRSWLLGELKRWVEWAPLSKRFLSSRLPQILGSAVQENVQTPDIARPIDPVRIW